MARRRWGRSIILAVLAAAGFAAAQFGLGYGLGIVVWLPRDPQVADAAWAAGLAWTAWTAANSVVIGAVIGDRVAGNVYSGRVLRTASRLAMSLAAALGGLITIPLVAIPTQQLRIVDNFAPHLLAGIYAAAGVLVGLVVALLALASRAIAANIMATAGFLWVLATVAVAESGGRSEVTQLGIWKFTNQGPIWHSFYIPGALLMLGGALMLGGLAAFPAAGRGEGRTGVTVSGAMGPILVAAAYGLAAPRPGHATFEQLSAFYTSPYMIVAGLVGSALVGAVGVAPARRADRKVAGKPAPGPTPASPAIDATPPSPTAPTPTAGRRSTTLPATSPAAVTATASVPAASRVNPTDPRHP